MNLTILKNAIHRQLSLPSMVLNPLKLVIQANCLQCGRGDSFISEMNSSQFQKVCDLSFARLDSIAKASGISDKPMPSPVISPAVLELAEALALCPTDDSARKVLTRYSAGYPGFSFVVQLIGPWLQNGTISYDDSMDEGVCPFFHIANYVTVITKKMDDFHRSKMRGESTD